MTAIVYRGGQWSRPGPHHLESADPDRPTRRHHLQGDPTQPRIASASRLPLPPKAGLQRWR